uniref:Uncharacterized protein n=1 Tax=Parascaris equorum TaxID=6256 RepID=A0A914RA06_PAREQ
MVDNQLLSTERWQVLYCQQNALTGDPDPADHMVMRPALKLEMNCTPFEHYDAFDVGVCRFVEVRQISKAMSDSCNVF